MRFFILGILLSLVETGLMAQKYSSAIKRCIPSPDMYEGQAVYRVADQMPMYGKGMSDLANYISKNLTLSDTNKKYGLRSSFRVTCVIDTLGNARNVCCITPCDYYTPEEKQLIKLMEATRWTPGAHDGKNVCVRLTVPLTICLK